MGFNFLDHFSLRTRCAASRVGLASCVHELHGAADVFMVNNQQRAVVRRTRRRARRAQREVVDAVMVVARALGKVGVGSVVFVVANIAGEGVAQGVHNCGGVASRHSDSVRGGFGNCGKAKRCW